MTQLVIGDKVNYQRQSPLVQKLLDKDDVILARIATITDTDSVEETFTVMNVDNNLENVSETPDLGYIFHFFPIVGQAEINGDTINTDFLYIKQSGSIQFDIDSGEDVDTLDSLVYVAVFGDENSNWNTIKSLSWLNVPDMKYGIQMIHNDSNGDPIATVQLIHEKGDAPIVLSPTEYFVKETGDEVVFILAFNIDEYGIEMFVPDVDDANVFYPLFNKDAEIELWVDVYNSTDLGSGGDIGSLIASAVIGGVTGLIDAKIISMVASAIDLDPTLTSILKGIGVSAGVFTSALLRELYVAYKKGWIKDYQLRDWRYISAKIAAGFSKYKLQAALSIGALGVAGVLGSTLLPGSTAGNLGMTVAGTLGIGAAGAALGYVLQEFLDDVEQHVYIE